MTINNLNRVITLASFLAVFAFFGAGCGKSEPKTSVVIPADNGNQVTDQAQDSDNQVKPKPKQQAEVGDPDILAILLLTQGSKVTVTRGEEQTDGVHQMELYAGDNVLVKTGEAQLLYPEVGLSILPQGTKLTIIPAGDQSKGGFSTWIILEAGKIWTRLEKVLGVGDEFIVEGNNVVATVRGTAFGVSLENGTINVTVADSQVQVTSRQVLSTLAKVAEQAVIVSAGNALKVRPADISNIETVRATLLPKLVKISDTDKKDIYYRFGLKALDLETLKKPDQTFKWSAPININQTLQDRLSADQLESLQLIRDRQIKIRPELLQNEVILRETLMEPIRFQIPLREIMLIEMTTTESPSADGPTL